MLFKNHHNKKIPYIFYMGIRSALQADATVFVMLGSKHSLMELETKSCIADRLEIYTIRGTFRTQSNIWDGAFCENS